jgi:hypothetical protein
MSIKHQRRLAAEQTKLLDNTGQKIVEPEKRRRVGPAQRNQIPAGQAVEAAYTKLTKTTKGTPEHSQALGGFISLLFPENGNRLP